MSYKDIGAVKAAQIYLLDVVHTLKQVGCIKRWTGTPATS